ncbi:MAG TPA: hypothetical protein VMH28_10600 [Candidatus Acidoferrales bacterium]|nr:hypothetical protein [Candidatus Acidoferrales bacterium]
MFPVAQATWRVCAVSRLAMEGRILQQARSHELGDEQKLIGRESP